MNWNYDWGKPPQKQHCQKTLKLWSFEGEQNMPPLNMSVWHNDYFELIPSYLETSQYNDTLTPSVPLKADQSSTRRYPPCTRRAEGILITRDREFRAEKVAQTNLVTPLLISYPKPKPLCFINSSQICFLVEKVWKSCGHFFGSHIFNPRT